MGGGAGKKKLDENIQNNHSMFFYEKQLNFMALLWLQCNHDYLQNSSNLWRDKMKTQCCTAPAGTRSTLACEADLLKAPMELAFC